MFRLFFGSDWRAIFTDSRPRSQTPCRTVSALLALTFLAGCADKHEEITSYRVPAAASISEIDAAKRADRIRKQLAEEAADATPAVKGRMLAAIIPRASSTWFLKFSGPVEQVSPLADSFRKFLGELKFVGETPKWTVPADWTELPGDTNRFATLQVPTSEGKPLELTITVLKSGGDIDLNGYLLANVNRWRGQMGLDPTENPELSKALEQFPLTADGGAPVIAYLVDLEGTLSSGGMTPPFAKGFPDGRKRGPRNAMKERDADPKLPTPPQLGAEAPRVPLTFTVPAGWQPGELKIMRLVAFEVVDGNKRIDITISTAKGSKLANINRWRGQVDLPDVTEADLAGLLLPITVDFATGSYVRLVGPPEKNQTILAASVEHNGKTWFFKLWGDSALAAREEKQFEAFVKSVKFSGAEGTEHGQ